MSEISGWATVRLCPASSFTAEMLATDAVFICSRSGHEIHDSTEVSYERTVYKYVMDFYTPSVRPVKNDSDTVDVELDLYIYLLEDLVPAPCSLLYTVFVVVVTVR